MDFKVMRFVCGYVFLLSLFSCGTSDTPNTEDKPLHPVAEGMVTLTPEQMKNAGIRIGKAEAREISGVVRLNGKVDVSPQSRFTVSFPLGGYVKGMVLFNGMQVKKGDLLMRLGDVQIIQLQQDFLAGKAKLKQAEADFLRQKELNQSKAVSDKVYQAAESEYESLKVSQRSIAEKLRLIGIDPDQLTSENLSREVAIRAPVAGYVASLNVNDGKFVNPTDVLLEIVDPSHLILDLQVFEREVALIQPGMELDFTTLSEPEGHLHARVLYIGKDITADRNFHVVCDPGGNPGKLIPGMYVTAMVSTGKSKAWTLPETAVMQFDNRSFVFVPRGKDTFEMMPVSAGESSGSFIPFTIGEGGNEGTLEYVTDGAYFLLMRIKNSAPEE